MTVISIQLEDKSNFLCKRFAAMASHFFDEPAAARTPTAQIPLENLFRILEMFRNNTFSDERRKGVLALDASNLVVPSPLQEQEWHTQIREAVHQSIVVSFGEDAEEKEAVDELQGALRWLAVDSDLPDREAAVNRAKTFFGQLSNHL